LNLIGCIEDNEAIFPRFHVLKTPTICKWTLAYCFLACHWWVAQSVHN
jgi:hypothetical protein